MRVLLFTSLFLTGCVSYAKAPVSLSAVATEIDARAAGPLDFAGAVDWAKRHNPVLKRLAAEARAAGLEIVETQLAGGGDTLREDASVALDPLALAKVYQRGAAAKSAQARQLAALTRLREQQRRIAAEIAEALLVERTLAELERRLPAIQLDGARFVKAGLASEADRQRAEFARMAERAERATISSERRANHARLRRLLALPPGAALVLALPQGWFPVLADPAREQLLLRPDLAVALAGYQVADAEFREAVHAQYPSLRIGALWDVGTGGLGGLVSVRIPVGAGARARAAGARREAARRAVEDGLLRAQEQAEARHATLLETQARADAFAARAAAAMTGYSAALARLDTDAGAFGQAAAAASLAARSSMQARQTALLAARARVAYAEAYGWPRPEEIR